MPKGRRNVEVRHTAATRAIQLQEILAASCSYAPAPRHLQIARAASAVRALWSDTLKCEMRFRYRKGKRPAPMATRRVKWFAFTSDGWQKRSQSSEKPWAAKPRRTRIGEGGPGAASPSFSPNFPPPS